MIDYGNDYEYANSRLSQTIVLYEDNPVYVDYVNLEDGITPVKYVHKPGWFDVHVSDLYVSPFKLGYINWTTENGVGSANLLSRSTARHWKQGLRSYNVKFDSGVSVQYILKGLPFCNMVRGIYPSKEECIEMLENGEATSQAFCRNFSITDSAGLLYRKVKVGGINMDNAEIKFNKQFEFLSPLLDEKKGTILCHS